MYVYIKYIIYYALLNTYFIKYEYMYADEWKENLKNNAFSNVTMRHIIITASFTDLLAPLLHHRFKNSISIR